MKQLDLFGSYEQVTPRPMGEGVTPNKPDNSEKDGVRALTPTKLAHYRAKLAKLDETGYDEVAEVITSDTIHGHNKLARDLRTVGTLSFKTKRNLTLQSYKKYSNSRLYQHNPLKEAKQ